MKIIRKKSYYFNTTYTSITIILKARLYVPFDIACFTNDFATPFELAVAVFCFSYCCLGVSSSAAHLIAAVCTRRADITLAAHGAERSEGV